MSIGTERCWVVTGIPVSDGWEPCYPDAVNAQLVAAEYRGEGHQGADVASRGRDCYTADCDGCHLPLEGDEGIVHAPDRALLNESITTLEWIVAEDRRVLCEQCRHHPIRGGRPAPAPAWPCPNQMPLFDASALTPNPPPTHPA